MSIQPTTTARTAEPRPTIIGLTGRAGSGKDTAAAYLAHAYGFHRAAFADPLRETAAAFLRAAGVADPDTWLTDPARKNLVIPTVGYSARHIMQTLGTEWGRTELHNWIWIDILERRLGLRGEAPPVADRIVITDARFPNELRWLRFAGATVIRLHRTAAAGVRDHASESHVDALDADVMLLNDGDQLPGLHALLDGAMASLGITAAPKPQEDLFTPTAA